MLTIRPYRESDAESVGRLIADTYSRFNLSFASADELGKLLSPFRHAWSAEPAHREAVAQVIRAPMVFVAEEDGEIVGVLRGRKERLAMTAALHRLATMGAVVAFVGGYSLAANALYGSAGFTEYNLSEPWVRAW